MRGKEVSGSGQHRACQDHPLARPAGGCFSAGGSHECGIADPARYGGQSVDDGKQRAGPPGSNSPSTPRLDLLGLATLVGVVVMLTISAVNLWNLKRLGDRVGKIEAAMGVAREIWSRSEPGLHGQHCRLTHQRTGYRAGDDRRVLRVPVPVLCQGRPHSQGGRRDVQGQAYESSGSICRSPSTKTRSARRWRRKPRGNRASSGSSTTGCSPTRQAWTGRLEAARKGFAARYEAFRSRCAERREKKKIDADVAEANELGISGTPSIYINGRFIAGAQPFETFAKIIDEELTKRNLPIPSGRRRTENRWIALAKERLARTESCHV